MCVTSNVRGSCWCRAANPRANHSLRTLPPSQSLEYAVAHDEGLWGVAEILLDIQGREAGRQFADAHGRIGIALRTEMHRSCLASWADALLMISDRNLIWWKTSWPWKCRVATVRLDREGFTERPTWPVCDQASGNTAGSFGLLPSDAFFRKTPHCHAELLVELI